MPETVIQDNADKFVDQVPTFGKFQLPKDFDKKEPAAPPPEAKTAESAPVAEGVVPEQTEPTTTGKDPEKPEEKKEEQPSSRRFERRIDRATKARAEAEARAEMLAKELAEFKAKQASPVDPEEPKMEQFNDIEEYGKAKVAYGEKKAEKAFQAKQQQEQSETAQKRLNEGWAKTFIEGEDKYDDWHEVVGEIKPATPLHLGIMMSGSADVAHYLGKHLNEARKILAMEAPLQLMEVGRLAERLSKTPVAPKTPSKAPPPISPVGAAATSKEASVADPMPMDQYMKVGAKAFRR